MVVSVGNMKRSVSNQRRPISILIEMFNVASEVAFQLKRVGIVDFSDHHTCRVKAEVELGMIPPYEFYIPINTSSKGMH